MIVHSARVRIVGDQAKAMAWAQEMTDVVNKITGGNSKVATHLAGEQEIVFITNHDSARDFETFEGRWRNHPEYLAVLEKGAGLLDLPSTKTEALRTL